MSHFVVDVETDGPIPGFYSIINFAILKVTPQLDKVFYGEMAPISPFRDEEAAAISGINRDTHNSYKSPNLIINQAIDWVERINNGKRAFFWSDNNGFDWSFINYYFHAYGGKNPFGYSSRRIGDLYCGLKSNPYAKWKHLRDTQHTHNPIDDAKGNAEALLKINNEFNLKLKFK